MAGNLTRFDPLRDMVRFEPFRQFEDFFKDFALVPGWHGMDMEPRIRMDVTETEREYAVQAEIPGVKKEDIRIAIEGNKVSIQAEIKQENDAQQNGNKVRSERYYGQCSRSFMVPQEVDETNAQATYQDGILKLLLPKKAGGGGKQVPVQ